VAAGDPQETQQDRVDDLLARDSALVDRCATPLVPAEPARQHMAWLQSNGIGVRKVARLTGISLGSLSKLLYGYPKHNVPPSRRIRRTARDAILAVRPVGADDASRPVPPERGERGLDLPVLRPRPSRIGPLERERLLAELIEVLTSRPEDPEDCGDSWRDEAACAGVPLRLFFPNRGDDDGVVDAKRICRACPVRAQCLEANLHELDGIFGGTTERERHLLRDALRSRREVADRLPI